jgi:hypothetical protein
MNNRKIKYLFVIIFLIFTPYFSSSQDLHNKNNYYDTSFGIVLYGYYNCDTLSLLIDDQYVLQNQVYTSLINEFTYSFSRIYVFFKNENDCYNIRIPNQLDIYKKTDTLQYNGAIKLQNQKISKDSFNKKNIIKITFIINNISIETFVDISAGKFIFFRHENSKKFFIHQNSFISDN